MKILKNYILLITILFSFSVTAEEIQLLSVQCIWDGANHCAFTDLIEFNDALYCCFREADDHAGGTDGTIRILRSDNGFSWSSVSLLSKEGIDLRDPKLSTMPDGRLLLTLGGSTYQNGEYVGSSAYAAFSEDGIVWTEVIDLNMPGDWIWRVTWHQGIGYGVSYSPKYMDPNDPDKAWGLMLFQTKDGLHYFPMTQIKVPGSPNEVTLRFLPDDTMVAMVRRHAKGMIGTSKPPYLEWKWKTTDTYFGGQNFLILEDGSMWGSSRFYKIVDGEVVETHTAVGPMTMESFKPALILPSGGDTSYPGMVYRDDILYVSYYSSHEGKTSIYLAQILLTR